MDTQTFDAIVSDFYKAATGALPWDRALDSVQKAFSVQAVILQTADSRTGQILRIDHGGPPLHECILSYIREYHRHDPARLHVLERMPDSLGNWWHCQDHFDETFVSRSRYYQEFATAYDHRYMSATILSPTPDLYVGFSLQMSRSRGVLLPEEGELARRLGEHLREALQAYQRVRSMMAQALAGHTLLQSYPYPMWLFDEQRFISFENQAALREIECNSRITRHGAHFFLNSHRANQQLSERMHQLQRDGHGATALVNLRATAADPPTWLHLSMLAPGAVLGAFGERAQVLATLFDPHQVNALDTFALSNMFGLTPTEAKVAAHLAEGLSAAEIAQSNGTALPTVRSQIAQVLVKFGAHRVTDVVRLLRQGEALWSVIGKDR